MGTYEEAAGRGVIATVVWLAWLAIVAALIIYLLWVGLGRRPPERPLVPGPTISLVAS